MLNQVKPTRFIIFLLSVFLFVACGGGEVSFSTANIRDASLAKDSEGAQTTTVFEGSDTFYLIVDLANAPDATTVRVDWTAVDVIGNDPNMLIDDVEMTGGSGIITFDLTNDKLWPDGDYKVDLYLNDELDRTLTFQVEGSAAAESINEPAVNEPEPVVADAKTTTEAEEAPAAAEEEPVAVAGGAVQGIENVREAVIQIQAQGSFVDPEFGQQTNTAGRGSGFIIDPSGIAVTNNHVVTGAALVKVYLAGETEPRNARILGVSECSDLAVIDIEGGDFPYVEWYDGDINVGMDMYVAGFPLGDTEFTLTRGIVSKANANGETNWASVDEVIEYDANTNPGNSGGPVLTPEGQVIAVHYAGYSAARQAFGINSSLAKGIIEQMQAGSDVDSIGINGRAVIDDGLSGIWVSSVQSGSPASRAGIRGGDIIVSLEGLVLATDGTMSDYCDILRSHDATDMLAIEVLRFASQEVLEGELNGRELEQSYSFAEAEDTEETTTQTTNDPTYASYHTVTDQSEVIFAEIPTAWGEVDGRSWEKDNGDFLGVSLIASPNIEGFFNSWSVPGVRIRASQTLEITIDEALSAFDHSDNCIYSGRDGYENARYDGQYDLYSECGLDNATFVILALPAKDGSHIAIVEFLITGDADVDAIDRLLDTLTIG